MEPPWRLAGSHAIVATPNLVLIKVVCHNLGIPDVRSPAMPRVVMSRWSLCLAGRYLGHARRWAWMYPERDEAMPPPPNQRSSPSRVMRVFHRLWGGGWWHRNLGDIQPRESPVRGVCAQWPSLPISRVSIRSSKPQRSALGFF